MRSAGAPPTRVEHDFGPDLADALAEAWRAGGGRVDFTLFDDVGADGHLLPEMGHAIRLWGPTLDRHLARAFEMPAEQVASQPPKPCQATPASVGLTKASC